MGISGVSKDVREATIVLNSSILGMNKKTSSHTVFICSNSTVWDVEN